MKQILLTGSLLLVLVLAAIGCDCMILHECGEITDLLDRPDAPDHVEQIDGVWEDFSEMAAYFTGYELIRSADTAHELYLAAYLDDPESVDTKTAREQFRQAVEEIRKIHAFRMERVF